MEEHHLHHHHQEMQFLSYTSTHHGSSSRPMGPSLDLQLSISVSPPSNCCLVRESTSVDALKWEAAEQIRLAAMEKAYADHVMELTRREMEMAQSEFLRARSLWERAREEVERADKMKERAASGCMEITCFSCRQKFTP